MVTRDVRKQRRLNVVVSETLNVRLVETAQARGMSKSAFVRQAIEREFERSQDEALEAAAEALAPIYESDEELTAFTALDSEDFA